MTPSAMHLGSQTGVSRRTATRLRALRGAAACLCLLPASSAAQSGAPAPGGSPGQNSQVAFPGAVGFGRFAAGGRGGAVLRVTSLADDGPGTLRAALAAAGPRTILFDVGGVIRLRSPLVLEQPFVTLAGQSAPSPGITVADQGVHVRTHDVVVRHLRFRAGDHRMPPSGWDDHDAVSLDRGAARVIFSHCSFTWAVNANVAVSGGAREVTLQNCLLAEGLHRSRHPSGPHSVGLAIGGGASDVTVYRSLFAHNGGGNLHAASGVVQFVNNSVVNWGGGALQLEGSDPKRIDVVGSTFIAGADTVDPTEITVQDGTTALSLHTVGNYGPKNPLGDDDNWATMVRWSYRVPVTPSLRAAAAHAPPIPNQTTAALAHIEVLERVGATRPRRCPIDARVLAAVRTHTGRIIDAPSQVGGFGEIAPGATAVADSDGDGMTDAWEVRHGFDPNDPADGLADRDGDGFTNLEEFLDRLAG